jgi:hypothetical protein
VGAIDLCRGLGGAREAAWWKAYLHHSFLNALRLDEAVARQVGHEAFIGRAGASPRHPDAARVCAACGAEDAPGERQRDQAEKGCDRKLGRWRSTGRWESWTLPAGCYQGEDGRWTRSESKDRI